MSKELFMMGKPEVFGGEAKLETNLKFYGESADFFASLIKEQFKPSGSAYQLADLGGAGGELCTNILKLLPEYQFVVDVFDVDHKALARNKIAAHAYNADLTHLLVVDKSYDISIMRYVLQWNTINDQEKIVREVRRITRGLAIIQHCGPDDQHRDEWRTHSEGFINGSGISRIRRKDYFYSSPEEVEAIFKLLGVVYKRIQSRKIEGYVNIFIERYSLDVEESDTVRRIVGDYNYIMQTSWLLDFVL